MNDRIHRKLFGLAPRMNAARCPKAPQSPPRIAPRVFTGFIVGTFSFLEIGAESIWLFLWPLHAVATPFFASDRKRIHGPQILISQSFGV
jgi:hypothetical protein